MSVVQDWVNGDFQDYDTVCGLLNYTRGLVFKGTRFAKEADFSFTDSRIFYYVKTIQELYRNL